MSTTKTLVKNKELVSEVARSLGARGGKARARNLTPEQLSEIGRLGVLAKKRKRAAEKRALRAQAKLSA